MRKKAWAPGLGENETEKIRAGRDMTGPSEEIRNLQAGASYHWSTPGKL